VRRVAQAAPHSDGSRARRTGAAGGLLGMASAIITASALSFLRLRIKPPTPDSGNMLAEGRKFLQHAWWAAFFPGLAMMLTVFAINLLGDSG
jgi:ABC-type dipeptide/oligopeptide/nickel transport system permease subunit